jgi:hypothetical protein
MLILWGLWKRNIEESRKQGTRGVKNNRNCVIMGENNNGSRARLQQNQMLLFHYHKCLIILQPRASQINRAIKSWVYIYIYIYIYIYFFISFPSKETIHGLLGGPKWRGFSSGGAFLGTNLAIHISMKCEEMWMDKFVPKNALTGENPLHFWNGEDPNAM